MTILSPATILLALAWFFAINAAASWCAQLLGAALLSSRHRADTRLLLAVRLVPAAASILFVSTVFLPSHWRLEPADAGESFGVVLCAMSAGGAALLVRSGVRAIAVARAGRRLLASERMPPSDPNLPEGVYAVDGLSGVSLAGVFRTRVLVGPDVTRHLSPEELDVAVAHERAHGVARDNLKRFLVLCAPDLFGGSRIARRLEGNWGAAAESLADARAAGGDTARALHLASALIKVARISSGPGLPEVSPAWSTLHDPPLLDLRVRRLVASPAPSAPRYASGLALRAIVVAAIVLLAASAALGSQVHRLTEALVLALP